MKQLHATTRTQIGVFFPMILLKPFEPPNVPGVGAGAVPGAPLPKHDTHQHPVPCPPGLLLFRVSMSEHVFYTPRKGERKRAHVQTMT